MSLPGDIPPIDDRLSSALDGMCWTRKNLSVLSIVSHVSYPPFPLWIYLRRRRLISNVANSRRWMIWIEGGQFAENPPFRDHVFPQQQLIGFWGFGWYSPQFASIKSGSLVSVIVCQMPI
jgi:hypothetical protein